MTSTELRDLLERVEAHGGPVKVRHQVDSMTDLHAVSWPTPPVGTAGAYIDDVFVHQRDQLVGVLKRDLIERGALTIRSTYVNGRWFSWTELARKDPYEEGATELEALLKAWLAAAEVEGWSS